MLQDAAAAGSYDFDEAKVDGCGPADNITEWATALREHGLQLENCGDSRPPDAQPLPAPMPPQWAVPTPSELGEHCDFGMYRVSADIAPQFMSGTSAQPPVCSHLPQRRLLS